MLLWKKQSNGETALLIEGARRVGKSTVVQQFAENEYKSFLALILPMLLKQSWNCLRTYPTSTCSLLG